MTPALARWWWVCHSRMSRQRKSCFRQSAASFSLSGPSGRGVVRHTMRSSAGLATTNPTRISPVTPVLASWA